MHHPRRNPIPVPASHRGIGLETGSPALEVAVIPRVERGPIDSAVPRNVCRTGNSDPSTSRMSAYFSAAVRLTYRSPNRRPSPPF